MNAFIKKTVLNLLVCSGTHANGIRELMLPNNFDIMIYGFLSAFQVKEENKLLTDQLLGNTKKLCHGCNRTFESFSSKHLVGFLSSCLVMFY